MLVKKIFSPSKVLWYMRYELAFATVWALVVWILFEPFGLRKAMLPFSIAATLGGALAIFLGFRNNNSYARWWEARQIWGGIINSSRVLGRLVITFTDSHAHQANYDQARSERFKKSLIYKQIAWVHALRLHLRGQSDWSVLAPLLSPAEYQQVLQAQNKPHIIQMLMGREIYQAMAQGTLGGFDSFQMEGQLLALAGFQGNAERIKNTPLLRQYHFFTGLFLYTFLFLLPFCLVGDFQRMEMTAMMIPVSILVSFVFATIAKVGEVNEDPFENRITDVPMTALAMTIERDLRESLGEATLPAAVMPVDGVLD